MSAQTLNPAQKTGRSGEAERVRAWRFDFAQELGFDPPTCGDLAETPSIDMHELRTLIRNKCPLQTALRILAPLPGCGAPLACSDEVARSAAGDYARDDSRDDA